MNYDLKDFIDVNQHYSKLQRNAQKIRSKQPMAQTNIYLHDLFDYFISDIEDIANQTYDEVLLRQSKKEIKITPSELKILIQNVTESSLQSYNRIIQGYNMGGMLREYDNVQTDIDAFKEHAKQTCKKQSDLYFAKHKESLKKQRNDQRMLNASLIAAITGIAGIVIAIWYGQTSNHDTHEKQVAYAEGSNICLASNYIGYPPKHRNAHHKG